MDRAVDAVTTTLETEYCKLLELLPDGEHLLLKAGIGWREGEVGTLMFDAGLNSQAGYTAIVGVPVSVDDLPNETRFHGAPVLLERGVVSGIDVVILVSNGYYGVLGTHTTRRRQFTLDDANFLQAVANIIGPAIERNSAYEAERKARAEAEEANHVKVQFLGMISHELRTPLASIKGFTSTLLAPDIHWTEEQQREFLAIVDTEANKLKDLVSQLLDVSSLEAGTLRIRPVPMRVEDVLDSAMPQLQAITAEHKLTVELAPDLPMVKADNQRIGQVIVNLVDNASKYSPPKSPIALTAAKVDNMVQITVRDHGDGIAYSDRSYIFEPFRRAEKQARQRGAGLGLAVCKGVVEAHGGRIWIHDDPPPGTLISFTLPIQEPVVAQPPAPKAKRGLRAKD
jgi:K+-sensing histidine kinase KdpD